MEIIAIHRISGGPPESTLPPVVNWWLELGADGRLHLMAKNFNGLARTIFTVCQDGNGYLNKNQDTPVAGLQMDVKGRLELRGYLPRSTVQLSALCR